MHWQVFYGTEGTLENRRIEGGSRPSSSMRRGCRRSRRRTISDPSAPLAALAGGHGTSEFYMVDGFIRAVRDGSLPPIDIYRSLDYSVPALCAHLSTQQGAAPVVVPNYRDGL